MRHIPHKLFVKIKERGKQTHRLTKWVNTKRSSRQGQTVKPKLKTETKNWGHTSLYQKNQEWLRNTHTQEAKPKEVNTAKEPKKSTTVPSKSKPKYTNSRVQQRGTETCDIRQFLCNQKSKPKPESGSNPEIKTLSTATGSKQGPSNSIKSKGSNLPKLITRPRGQPDSDNLRPLWLVLSTVSVHFSNL